MLGHYILCLLLISTVRAAVNDPFYTNDVSVETLQGDVQGFRVDYGTNRSNLFYGAADVFLGIPYVQAPVGPLRFQKPLPPCPFDAVPFDATNEGPVCPQDGASNSSMSEDCLYLNVFSPNVTAINKAPVMLWIHGGSMKSGSARDFGYKGAIRNLVSRGVVVVVIQYRLGMLGFFTTHTDDFAPNLGMLDQVEAIHWVRNNIAYFGGDPYRITLFGQSAGGASVSAHTYSPLSQNMFQGVIMESGVALTCFEGSLGFTNMSFLRAQTVCNTTQQQWENNDFSAMKDCLMKADYHTWLALDSQFQDVMGWKMSQDSLFMPGVPADLAKNRPNIPVLIGSMLNEWSLFDLSFLSEGIPLSYYTKPAFGEEFNMFCGFMGSEETHVREIVENVYTPPGTADDDHVAWLQINDRALTCAGFTGVIGQEIDGYLAMGNKNVYLYQMVYPPNVGLPPFQVPGWKPVPHAAEVPYVWLQEHHWNQAIQSGSVTADDYALLDWFGETWTNFAKYSFPRRSSEWYPLSTRGQLDYYEINVLNNTMKNNYRAVDQTIWNQVVPVLAGPLPPKRPDYNNGTNYEVIREQYRESLLSECPVFVPTSSISTVKTSTSTTLLPSSSTTTVYVSSSSTGNTAKTSATQPTHLPDTVSSSSSRNPPIKVQTTSNTDVGTKSSVLVISPTIFIMFFIIQAFSN